MRRSALIVVLALAIAIATPAVLGAPKRMGVLLVAANCPTPPELVKSLADLGWIEGQTIEFDCLSVKGRIDALPSAATALVARRPDVIVSGYVPGIQALKSATSTIPIVALNMADPVGQGLIESLSRPGGNVTGLVSVMFELESKRIELLKQVLPKMTRLAVIYRKGGDETYWKSTEQALARAAKVHRFSHEWFYASGAEDLSRAFGDISSRKFDAVYLVPSPMIDVNSVLIGQLSGKYRLPCIGQDSSIGFGSKLSEVGVLLTYGPSVAHIAQRSAVLVDKILKGARPAVLPAEQPTQFELTVNLNVARTLGLTIPQSVLLRADRVIE